MESYKKLLINEQLQTMYESVDEDGDGMLSPQEINGFLGRLGMGSIPPYELHDMMGSFSKTHPGLLTLGEFAEFYESLLICKQNDIHDGEDVCRAMEEAFNVYDENRDGFICAQEIYKTLSCLGFLENRLVSDCQDMIAKYDTNSDGLIDFSEFKSMMMMSA